MLTLLNIIANCYAENAYIVVEHIRLKFQTAICNVNA